MRLRQSLAAVAEVTPECFEDLRRNIDAAWVLQALEATGTATLRRRRLPAEQVIWLVIGMALYRNRSIHDVVTKLDLALPGSGASLTVAPSSVVEARGRVGAEPLEWLFTISAEHWAHASARDTAGVASRSTAQTARRCGCPIRENAAPSATPRASGQSGY